VVKENSTGASNAPQVMHPALTDQVLRRTLIRILIIMILRLSDGYVKEQDWERSASVSGVTQEAKEWGFYKNVMANGMEDPMSKTGFSWSLSIEIHGFQDIL
jgi:hypothetical protein